MQEVQRSIVLGGRSIAYVHRQHPRSRGLRLTIDPARGLVVSTPPVGRRGWAADATSTRIEAFLRDRESWIRRHLDRLERERSARRLRGGATDGGHILYHGVAHRIRLAAAVPGARASVVDRRLDQPDAPELIVRPRRGERRSIDRILEAWLRQRAADEIGQAIDRHGPAMGVAPKRVDIRDPKTRWGSASRTGRLMLSWRLVLGPRDALETVVVHELAHLQVFGHGPRFWALVARRRPNHLADRAWLRRHASELHAALEPAEAFEAAG
ncbi:MAG TPA: SprT family zinc-dependent metalloprotease [Candidatus Limnocylindrales bacterium]